MPLLAGALSLAAPPALAESGRNVVIVLDASGSMNTKLPEGPTRMEAAKAALADLAGKLSDDTRVALRVYGHQSAPQKKDCRDSALIVGFGPTVGGGGSVALPPGTYELELGLSVLPETQRKTQIELKAGETLKIKLNRPQLAR